jgi:hypothetical protein
VCVWVSYPKTTTAAVSRVCVCPILKPQQQPSQRYRVCVISANHSNNNLSDIVCVRMFYPKTTTAAVSCVRVCPILKPQHQPSQRYRVCACVCLSYPQTTTTTVSAISCVRVCVCVCVRPILKPQRQPSHVSVCVLSSNHSNSRLTVCVCVCVWVSYPQTTTATVSVTSCVCGSPILKPRQQPSQRYRVCVCVCPISKPKQQFRRPPLQLTSLRT